jgi:hypothetical protein
MDRVRLGLLDPKVDAIDESEMEPESELSIDAKVLPMKIHPEECHTFRDKKRKNAA